MKRISQLISVLLCLCMYINACAFENMHVANGYIYWETQGAPEPIQRGTPSPIPIITPTLVSTSAPTDTDTAAPSTTGDGIPTPSLIISTPTLINGPIESSSDAAELQYHFMDAGVEERARHSLGKEAGEIITFKEWIAIKSFDAEVWIDENTATFFRGQPIYSLEDFKHCSELERLSLTQLHTSDLSPLHELEKLTALDISDGTSEFIDSLLSLQHLEYLLLDGVAMPIADIPGIENIHNLITVSLSNCSISDITPLKELEKLENLKYLDLSYNEIEDVSALSNMTSLVNLILPGNRIQDTSPLYEVQQAGVNITLDGNPTTEVMKPTVAISPTPESRITRWRVSSSRLRMKTATSSASWYPTRTALCARLI